MTKIVIISVFILLTVFSLSSLSFCEESITVTTYYPSPYGSYAELRAKKMAIGDNYIENSQYCWGAGCGPNVIPNEADLIVEGHVGIGTPNPADSAARLHIAGSGGIGLPDSILIDNTGFLSWKNQAGAIQRVLSMWSDDNIYVDNRNITTDWERGNIIFRTMTPTASPPVLLERMRIKNSGAVQATGGLIIEVRSGTPASPEIGRMWLQ